MESWDLLARVVILLGIAAGLSLLLRRRGQNAIVGYLLAEAVIGRPTSG